MKRNLLKSFIIIISVLLITPYFAISQNEKEKKVNIKTVKEIDGEKVVKDTTFAIKSKNYKEDFFNGFALYDGSDSVSEVKVNVKVDRSGKKKNQKVLILQGDKSNSYVWSDSADTLNYLDENGEETVIFLDDIKMEFEGIDSEKLRNEMEIVRKNLEDLKIEFDTEKVFFTEDMVGLEVLAELKELESLKELDNIKELENIYITTHDIPGNEYYDRDFYFFNSSDRVSEKELRDAGIKNMPDRLVVESIDLNINGGVVKLDFSTKDKINPKIVVYNYFGERVYSGKPDYDNGIYSTVIDLSKKQKGTYYLQITSKKSSQTKKLNIN